MPRINSENGKFRAMRSEEVASHFDASISPVPFAGCWLWTGTTTRQGYGVTRKIYMHRYSYERSIGPIPRGMHVLHRCDVPSCVNPQHLFLGTQRDNNEDKIKKGRARGGSMPGESHPSAKLTAEQVRELRARYAAGGISQTALGRLYGLKQAQVSSIVRRTSWADDA